MSALQITSIVEDPELVQRRRKEIVAAATELFSKQGFYRTTIKEIAALAGISSGLVYQYVREKDDVLLLVILDVVEAYAREIPRALEGLDDPIERLVATIGAYCRVVDKRRAFVDNAAVGADRGHQALDRIIKTFKRSGDFTGIGLDDVEDDQEQDIVLLAHILIDQARRDAGEGGNLLDGGAVKALLGKQLGGGRDDFFASPLHQLWVLDNAGDLQCAHCVRAPFA